MISNKKLTLMLAAGCLLLAAGCSPAVSAISKFQSGQIGSLSTVEWESLASLGSSLGLPIPQVTPDEAQAIVTFLQANNVQTTQDLEKLLNSGNVTVPPELASLFN